MPLKIREVPPLSSARLLSFFKSFKVDSKGCWVWTGTKRIYPRMFFGGKAYYPAHRVAVKISGRQTPTDLTVDHLCRNRLCVNPDHLEMVTLEVNILRGDCPTAKNARAKKCTRGHSLSGKNLIVLKSRPEWRQCRKCEKVRYLKYKAKNKKRLSKRWRDAYYKRKDRIEEILREKE